MRESRCSGLRMYLQRKYLRTKGAVGRYVARTESGNGVHWSTLPSPSGGVPHFIDHVAELAAGLHVAAVHFNLSGGGTLFSWLNGHDLAWHDAPNLQGFGWKYGH